MPHKKTENIEKFYKKSWKEIITQMYLNDKLSVAQIVEKIKGDTGVIITHRWVHLSTQAFGFSRTKSAARFVAIETGRVDYSKLRKPIKSKELRKGISLAVRYAILKRDNFRCVLCGADAAETKLVIDHKMPVVKGGTNDDSNLRILCTACNHGKMIYEKEK